MINADKPRLWKQDIFASVQQYNTWFLDAAPKAYRDTRAKTIDQVKAAFGWTNDMSDITPATLRAHPEVLPTLRMSTAPPIARDRLVGLAHSTKALVKTLEEGRLPPRMRASVLNEYLERICGVLAELLDLDLFSWLQLNVPADPRHRELASTVVADRLCGAVADPIVRNAQEQRQLALIEDWLIQRGYEKKAHPPSQPLPTMEPGTFAFRMNVWVGSEGTGNNIPVDVVVMPHHPAHYSLPVLIEAKSAGDFTNPNKRRKEEAQKVHQLRLTYGDDIPYLLFLCGYFDAGYLGYEAAEGLDWVWEHRIDDLAAAGV